MVEGVGSELLCDSRSTPLAPDPTSRSRDKRSITARLGSAGKRGFPMSGKRVRFVMAKAEVPFDLVRLGINDHSVLVVYGAVDILTSPKLHEALTELVEEDEEAVLLDLANVTFVDSSGLGTIVTADRHMRSRGRQLRLVAVPESCIRLFEVTGLSDRFHVFADRDSALIGTLP